MVTFITVAMPLLASMVCAVIAWRLLRVPLGLRYVERGTFREMATYSGTTLIIIVSSRLRFKSDSIIIGAFLSAAAITYFNIGARIVDYAGEVVENLAQLFLPMSSHADARGDQDRLRKILVAGNRFCAFTIFPLCAMLIVLGKSIITVWIGARYVEQSYPVLLILLLATTLMLAQAASPRVLFGMAKHRTWAIVTLIEGVVNVILSMILVRPYGIVGDALGTAFPLAATMIFFLPQHVCGKLQVPVRTFLREAYVLPLLVCAPLVATLLLMKRWFVPHNYAQLAVHLLVAGAVYGCVLGWAVFSKRATKVGRLIVSEEDLLEAAGAAAAAETTSLDI
jgi:O-antigen/teichoic acid export membrane protein